MKIYSTLFLCFSVVFFSFGQEQEKDTVQTEVVEVITTFNPKIADAQKIKKNPSLKFTEKSKKQQLEYKIFSAPVASTFVPKSGLIKGIDVGVKERLYKNYIAAGYGNFLSPYFEAFLHSSARFRNEFGISSKYAASNQNIKNTLLNSTFSNFMINAFYKKEARYFDWKVSFTSEKNNYNWYGLPEINFAQTTLNSIEEAQTYELSNLKGEFTFIDSYIDFANISLSYFTDAFNSDEININFNTKLDFPLYFIDRNLNDISINTGVEFLKGTFESDYANSSEISYAITTVKLHPEYETSYKFIDIKAGVKSYLSIDSENNANNIFILPALKVQSPVYKKYVNAYAGFYGDLHTNTYQKFTEENPYVSPTLFITQTLEKSNLFFGVHGNITNTVNYHIKISSSSEEDKPLFLKNNTKSDGSTSIIDGNQLLGYEYGNSFNIYYDDVKTQTLFAEFTYEFSKYLTFNLQGSYKKYTVTNSLSPWNLPSLETVFMAKYKTNKWFATANIFYVDERTDGLYNAQFPSSFSGINTLSSFVDANLNGGYHFNSKLSAFLKVNNLLNTKYQRFANFDVQGFQILGGITYKFDF